MRRIYLIAGVILTLAIFIQCRTHQPYHKIKTTIQPEDVLELSGGDSGSYSIYRAGNRYQGKIGDHFIDEVQPILAKRCVGCHSCTTSPCRLNLTSYEGFSRGVHPRDPYQLHIKGSFSDWVDDNSPIEHWRSLGFRPVLPQSGQSAESSVFLESLTQGTLNSELSQNDVDQLAAHSFTKTLICPGGNKPYSDLSKKQPKGGMPWALPALESTDFEVLKRWAMAGAPGPDERAMKILSQPQLTGDAATKAEQVLDKWRQFMGEGSSDLKRNLVARYVYEHAYYIRIHFEEIPGEFYRVVRSFTPYPLPVSQINTDSIQDKPPRGSTAFYRLVKITRNLEAKSHVVWDLNLAKIGQFEDLFFSGDWTVSSQPGWDSYNPFEYFQQIPADLRYRFLLDNAYAISQAFARGSVCANQGASWATDEHFWIWFLKPESDPSVMVPNLGLQDLRPLYARDLSLSEKFKVGLKSGEATYRSAFENHLRKIRPEGLGIDDIWNGDGRNDNAFLTAYRHQHSMEISKGLHGGQPKSVWLLSYANFERILYNSSIYFKYWGGIKHKIDVFHWQTYARTEGEDLYISLFADQDYRSALRKKLTTSVGRILHKMGKDYSTGRPSKLPPEYREEDLSREIRRLNQAIVKTSFDRLNHIQTPFDKPEIPGKISDIATWEKAVRTITSRPASFAKFLPNIFHIRLKDHKELYTFINQRGFENNKLIVFENLARRPDEDYIVAFPGFIGVFPYLFADVSWADASQFLSQMSQIRQSEDWIKFKNRFTIRRNSAQMWPFVDWLHDYAANTLRQEAAIMDLRFYDVWEAGY